MKFFWIHRGGALAVLRCKGIIENDWRIGCVFDHCYMDIDNDGVVSFLASPMSHSKESILKAKEIQFKPLFEKRIPLKKFDYTVDNQKLTIRYDNQEIKVNKANNNILDFSERNVLGYLQNDETIQRAFIFSEDIVYNFCQYIGKHGKLDPKVDEFKEECKNQGVIFDNYPSDDFFEECEYDYGELMYSCKFKKLTHFIHVFKVSIPMLFLYNLLILSIQLSSPQLKWGFYLIFGLANSLLVALIILIAALANNEHKYKYIEIYENGVKYQGYNVGFNIDYENITEIEYNNKIVLHTSIGKFTLHKSKNDKKIFELINQKVSKK